MLSDPSDEEHNITDQKLENNWIELTTLFSDINNLRNHTIRK